MTTGRIPTQRFGRWQGPGGSPLPAV